MTVSGFRGGAVLGLASRQLLPHRGTSGGTDRRGGPVAREVARTGRRSGEPAGRDPPERARPQPAAVWLRTGSSDGRTEVVRQLSPLYPPGVYQDTDPPGG